MNTSHPTPVDQAIDPDRHFTTEAFQWWSEEEDAYGALLLDGFEVHGGRLPESIAAELDAPFDHDCPEEPLFKFSKRFLALMEEERRGARNPARSPARYSARNPAQAEPQGEAPGEPADPG